MREERRRRRIGCAVYYGSDAPAVSITSAAAQRLDLRLGQCAGM